MDIGTKVKPEVDLEALNKQLKIEKAIYYGLWNMNYRNYGTHGEHARATTQQRISSLEYLIEEETARLRYS